MAPEIRTARLRLRSLGPQDLDRHAAALADPKVYEYLGARPSTREESWRKILSVLGLWTMLGYGYWAVEQVDNGLYLGMVGFADFKRDLDPSIEGIPEMGWIFSSDAHGRGYASEAVAAVIGWGEAHLDASRYSCIIAPGNAASIRVAEKAGFVEAGRATYHGDPTIILFRDARRA